MDVSLFQIAFTTGVVAARKRQFTLACCKGTAVQAVACVQIGPKNDDVQSFIGREACMYVRLLVVDPVNPQFKPGEHLLKEVRKRGRSWHQPLSGLPVERDERKQCKVYSTFELFEFDVETVFKHLFVFTIPCIHVSTQTRISYTFMSV